MGRQSMIAVPMWTGREAGKLRAALRMSQREYAAFLGVSPRTVANWEAKSGAPIISADMQAVLDTALDRADQAVQQRFAAFLTRSHAKPAPGKYDGVSAAEAAWMPSTPRDYCELICAEDAPRQHPQIPLSETDISVVLAGLERGRPHSTRASMGQVVLPPH
jgi:transcriptional regulator with XRE-family HTH domain